MPSLQSSSGTATPDPELFFDDLCFETPCDLDPDPEFFFGDLCFEAPCDLDATSDQDAPPFLDAPPHTDPALEELHRLPMEVTLNLATAHSRTVRNVSEAEEWKRRWLTDEEAKERPPNGTRYRRQLWLAERKRLYYERESYARY